MPPNQISSLGSRFVEPISRTSSSAKQPCNEDFISAGHQDCAFIHLNRSRFPLSPPGAQRLQILRG
jgi:hypothetical protein